jgi:hypothetical protein
VRGRDRIFVRFGAMLFVACTLGLVATSTTSADGGLRTIDLGAGASVRQVRTICWHGPCAIWVPEGLSFGDHPELEVAMTFARVPRTGRIVAARSNTWLWGGPYPMWNAVGLDYVLYTDDLGRTWQTATWRWWTPPRVIDFDPGSTFGVAAGDGGYVWNTEDGGATWVDRRDASGQSFDGVWVVGRVCVLHDGAGVTWVSRDGGFVLERLTDEHDVTIDREGDAIVVTVGRSDAPRAVFRVTRDGPSRVR